MNFSDYAAHDAVGLAELVKKGALSPDEPVAAARAAIAALNPQVNAFVDVDFERPSLAQDLPYSGIPMPLKDCVGFAAGASYRFGSRLVPGSAAPDDSEVIARYRAAGFHLLGITNVPEFSSVVTSESRLHGPVHNPWRHGFSAGGSSGGAAAAVASRMVPVAYANDGAGSIRVPASCCGVVGLKPSRGRIPTGPHKNDFWHGLVSHNVITRSVRDTAALIDCSAGIDPGAPYTAPPLHLPLSQELGAPVRGLRIAYSLSSPYGEKPDAQCVRAIVDLLPLLESMGCEVFEAAPDYDGRRMLEDVATLISVGLASDIPLFEAEAGLSAIETVERNNLAWAERGARVPAAELQRLLYRFGAIGRVVGRFFENGADLFLTPTTALPPPRHGWLDADGDDLDLFVDRFWRFSPFASLANVTGAPAISLPAGMTDDGLPLGAMFLARYGDEASLIRLASHLEIALDWQRRTPPTRVG